MKNLSNILITFLFILFGCSKDISKPVASQNDKLKFATFAADLYITANSLDEKVSYTSSKDNSPEKPPHPIIFEFFSYYKNHFPPTTEDWKPMHEWVTNKMDYHQINPLKDFENTSEIQQIALRMLHLYLSIAPKSAEVIELTEYYLDVLVKNEAVELLILAEGYNVVKEEISADKKRWYRSYIEDMARNQMEESKKTLIEMKRTYDIDRPEGIALEDFRMNLKHQMVSLETAQKALEAIGTRKSRNGGK